MQTLGKRVSELVAKSITSSSTPLSEDDISSFLKDGVRDFTIRALVTQNPNVLSMLTTTKTDVGTGISIDNGFLVSVVRNEAAASTTLNPATVIDASLRGRAADVKSLLYQSHYNPVYYILNGVVNTLPTPSSSTDYAEVSYVSSESAVNGTSYNVVEITSFPKTFSGLIVYYAAAMASLAYASNIHNTLDGFTFPNVPVFEGGSIPTFSVSFSESLPTAPSIVPIDKPTITVPTPPTAPVDLSVPTEAGNITLPAIPVFANPTLSYSLTDVNTQISNEDMDLIEKQFEKIDKNFSKFDKDMELARENYTEQLNKFNKEFDRLDKNNERVVTAKLTTYRENVSKYQNDIGKYSAELSSYTAQIQKYVADVSKFEKESSLDIAKFTQELGRYNAALSKYQADLASFQTEFKSYEIKLAKYQADAGMYQAELQKYSVELNKSVSEYQWYTQRYQLFYNQYLSGLTQAQPAQQAEA